jgi:transcriptional regulator with XRE-family HTH domain
MDTKELGKAIRTYRKSGKHTQEFVAQMSNTGARFLSELERGKETASLGLTLKIINNLGLDILLVPRILRNTPEYRYLQEAINDYTPT